MYSTDCPYNLAIDLGNSSIKLALFEQNRIVSYGRSCEIDKDFITKQLSPFNGQIGYAIISATAPIPSFFTNLLSSYGCKILFLDNSTLLPFSVDYLTPTTLGNDRIAGVAGACKIGKSENILIIDAGTAITFDYLAGNTFKGGNISLGLKMRFSALHHFTAKLPMVSPTENTALWGKTTSQAIESGVIFGVVYEINSYIRTFFDMYPKDSTIIFTGGDSGYLQNRIDYNVIYEPNLVLIGLNYILEYNVRQQTL